MAFTFSEISIPILAIIFGGVSFVICNLITDSMSWSIWHYDNINISTVWLGLWNYCYLPRDPSNPTTNLEKVCVRMNWSWEFPPTLSLNQDLMLLATILEGVGLFFTLVGLICMFRRDPGAELYHCFLIGGNFLAVGCAIVLFTVSWNWYLDSVTERFIFPAGYLPHEKPVDRDVGSAIPLGLISSLFVLQSELMLIFHGCNLSPNNQVHPTHV
ncbi:uncharacterized protein LOC103170850 [Ornithorhynchus anatinus]|uniref:uncharacterized protein LOC103170850 n=1 Tax=Ornithorhynchus anatinus TaxID=9258 RepID=UPI000454BAE5|nr:uncharacterized protein LOC103170850 [Ornithorhynchus anatinus]